jgi:predicted RNA-binding protein YlxR (DUF448 family)
MKTRKRTCIDCEKKYPGTQLWWFGGYHRCIFCEDKRLKAEIERLGAIVYKTNG